MDQVFISDNLTLGRNLLSITSKKQMVHNHGFLKEKIY